MSVLTLLDLSAAFDTLYHFILLRRLEKKKKFGICGMALKWFDSYIRERFQSVVINGLSSKLALLQHGVPQGSVLGPVLFTLYTLPVLHVMCRHKCGFHKFADDTELRKSALLCDIRLLTGRLEYCINEIKQWMIRNKLKLNDDKKEAMTVGTRLRSSISCGEHLKVGDYEIPFKPFVISLGVFLDSSLTMSKQVSNLCRTAFLEIRRVDFIRPFLTEKATRHLVCSRILN